MKLAVEVKEAIEHWFFLGLHPGGFAEACIVKDYKRVIYNSHPKIREHIPNHLEFADMYLPYQAKDMENWKGYNNLSEEEKNNIILTPLINQTLLNKI